MKKTNILIFPAGSENAINIHDSLKYNLHFNLFGASSNEDYAKSIYPNDNYFIGNLYINDSNFLDNLNNLLKKFNIDFIIPTHDTIALHLMENETKINAKIVCSPLETAKIANSKIEIFKHLSGKKYLPKIYNDVSSIDKFPVFLKPNIGAGGKGTYLAHNLEDLNTFLKDKSDILISENLPGEEITIDCFTNKNRELLFVGPRTRERITMGISFKSRMIDLTDEIKEIAEDLNNTFVFRGAWFFQLKKDIEGNYKLMEFSVRQAGTMALYRQLGINFAALSLFDFMDYNLKINFNNYPIYLERRLSNSYYIDYKFNNAYIDLDDTLIINNKVNSSLIKLIYQFINKGIKVILITKHKYDLNDTLKRYRINRDLFDEIICLNDDDKKSKYIAHSDSILIDNYFIERLDVKENCNIPVFDVDAIESLFDYSIF